MFYCVLIASFCSINPQYLPFLSIFLHDFLVICQFEPNCMTAEPNFHGRPTKPQRESGWEIVFRLLGNDRISQSGCRKYNGNCILKSCWPRKNIKLLSPLGKARKRRSLEWSGVGTRQLPNLEVGEYHWSYELQATTWKRFPTHSLFGVSLGDRGTLVQRSYR